MIEAFFLEKVWPLRGRVFRIARKYLTSQDEAEDLTQEIFTKLWALGSDLYKYENIEALVVTMTKNKAMDLLSLKKNKTQHLNSNEADKHLNSETQTQFDLDYYMRIIDRIIETLPNKQREVFIMRDFQQKSYEEIEKNLNISAVDVRVSLSRARKTIREKLENVLKAKF